MSDRNILLLLRQINICLGLYENEQLEASGMNFSQAFLLNELFSMDVRGVCSKELSQRVGFARSSISRTLKELQRNGYVRMRTDAKDNRKKHIILTKKAREAEPTVKGYMAELTGELLRAIPEYSLPEIENALQMILDNIQPEIQRRPIL